MNKELDDQELMQVTGGAIKWAVVGLIAGIGAFLAGIVDGYLRPFKCR